MRLAGKARRKKGGALFLTIIGAALFLGVLMSALFLTAQASSGYAVKGTGELEARYAAQAAIHRAFGELAADPTWRTGWRTPVPLTQNPELTYTLEVRDNALGTELAENECFLYAEGLSKDGDHAIPLAALGGTAVRPGAKFGEAGFGVSQILLQAGSVTDAFDSRKGDHWYNPGETDDAKKTEVEDGGHVGSMVDVTLDGSTVNGDVILPDPGSFTMDGVQHTGGAKLSKLPGGDFTGEEKNPKRTREIPQVDAPYEDTEAILIVDGVASLPIEGADDPFPTLAPGAYAAVTVKPTETIRLTAGDYYLRALSMKDATLKIDTSGGPVRVFIGASMDIQGSRINPSDVDEDDENPKPAELQMLFTDSDVDPLSGKARSQSSVDNSYVNAVMLGRGLEASFKASEFFGSVGANKIAATASKLHYDKATEAMDLSDVARWKLRDLVNLPPGS